jgi:hypothetical protein
LLRALACNSGSASGGRDQGDDGQWQSSCNSGRYNCTLFP